MTALPSWYETTWNGPVIWSTLRLMPATGSYTSDSPAMQPISPQMKPEPRLSIILTVPVIT
jgi:hypothetical protein